MCAWMVQQIKRATREKFQLSGEKQPPVPYIFTTPQGLELDLRLFNRWVWGVGGWVWVGGCVGMWQVGVIYVCQWVYDCVCDEWIGWWV